jgi:flagellar hook-associated protein 1 FlgK
LFTDAGGSLSGGFAPGIATRLQLNAAVDPRQGGEAWRLREGVYAAAQGSVGSNAILINLVDAFDAPRATTFSNGALVTAEGSAAGLAALRGATLSLHQSAATASAASRDILAEAELATIGVDTDAELQQLLVIEQAYAANARVIEVAARLLDRLTEL